MGIECRICTRVMSERANFCPNCGSRVCRRTGVGAGVALGRERAHDPATPRVGAWWLAPQQREPGDHGVRDREDGEFEKPAARSPSGPAHPGASERPLPPALVAPNVAWEAAVAAAMCVFMVILVVLSVAALVLG